MLKLSVIGVGAAGNKAAINLMEHGFDPDNVTLINSTSKDIPEEYRDKSVIFGSNPAALGGCGKERRVGKNLFAQDFKNGNINPDNFVNPKSNLCIVVSSTEGGTGSGVSPIVSKYISTVLGVPVILVLFFGFNSDVRGMQNSIELCQDLGDTYGVIAISNEKFLKEANGNKVKAESMANDEFSRIVKIICGQDLNPSKQNIDDTDLYKIVATPGYMIIGETDIKGVKNIESFNKEINLAIDDTKLIDGFEKSSKRIGVIFDISESMGNYVDFNANVISSRFGIPYEMFTHIQDDSDNSVVTWICTGLDFPIDNIKEIYENYKKASANVKKEKDSFFTDIADLSGNNEDIMFNMLTDRNVSKMEKDNFLSSIGL